MCICVALDVDVGTMLSLSVLYRFSKPLLLAAMKHYFQGPHAEGFARCAEALGMSGTSKTCTLARLWNALRTAEQRCMDHTQSNRVLTGLEMAECLESKHKYTIFFNDSRCLEHAFKSIHIHSMMQEIWKWMPRLSASGGTAPVVATCTIRFSECTNVDATRVLLGLRFNQPACFVSTGKSFTKFYVSNQAGVNSIPNQAKTLE